MCMATAATQPSSGSTNDRPDHPSLVPFDELSAEVQELDRPYAEAVAEAAARLGAG